ncbi:MAG: hypothetical protein NVSMB47_18330 [Polyangiales bacterium]
MSEPNARGDDIEDKIDRLQRAEEDVRRLQDELIDAVAFSAKPTLDVLREAIVVGLGEGEGPEAAIALVPLAEVLGECEGPEVCDLLVDLLGSDEPEVRLVSGRALQDLAYDRFREVAESIERAVKRLPPDSHALRELPFVIGEIGEPGVTKILRGYLNHAEPEIVAAAIEALASGGDPAALPELRKLLKDPRTVQIEDEAAEGQVSLGILAQEAISILEGDAPAPPHPPPTPHHPREERASHKPRPEPRPAGKRR